MRSRPPDVSEVFLTVNISTLLTFYQPPGFENGLKTGAGSSIPGRLADLVLKVLRALSPQIERDSRTILMCFCPRKYEYINIKVNMDMSGSVCVINGCSSLGQSAKLNNRKKKNTTHLSLM